MRSQWIAAGCVLAVAMATSPAMARPIASAKTVIAASKATDLSAQSRRIRRPATRLRVFPAYRPEPDGVYPRYYPGPNAKRDCTATYVQEYRPSGTVITPRVNCFWRPG